MRLGVAQIDCEFKNKSSNLQKCKLYIKQAKLKSVDLLVFPECTMNGYVYGSFDEAFIEAETVPGNLTDKLMSLCSQYQITAVFGTLEKDNDLLYNTAVLITPDGIAGKYRKTHLLYLGVDRFTSPGSSISVYRLPQAKVAPLVCYDLRAPEPTRVAALMGAQIILSPANLPIGAEAYSNFINKTRACENKVFIVSANRVGKENGFGFLGKSQIINSSGAVLAEASNDKEELIYADISPEASNIKHNVIIPGQYEYDIIGDRKPHLYDILVK